MTNRYTEDLEHHDEVFGNSASLVFSRRDGLLADHPITRGRDASEAVDRVITYTGQTLVPPPGSTALLKLSEVAREYPYRRSADDDFTSVAGLAQGVAVEHGKGRVVVMGEAAALSSQTFARPGVIYQLGMARDDCDNRQLVLNILHWLSRVI